MFSRAQIALIEEVASHDERWTPILRAAKEIEAHVERIRAQNVARYGPTGVYVCPWVLEHRPAEPE